MREIYRANMMVTLLQMIAVAIAYAFFEAGLSGICLAAAGTAGLGAISMAYGTWENPAENQKNGVIGLIALSATAAALGLWSWENESTILALCALIVVCVLAHLLAHRAKLWTRRPYGYLVLTALPNVGVVLGALVGACITVREIWEEVS